MKKILFGLVMLVSISLSAQQVPFYSQYFFNPFVYNSAYSGHNDEVRAFLMHRNQWTGIQGAPVTTMFTIDAPIQGDKAGLGLNVYSDRTDILTTSGARAAYSYGFNLNEEHLLKFGLGIGILNHTIDYSNAIVEDQTDPNLFSTSQSKSTIDADFGIAYFWRGLQIGIAIPQLLGGVSDVEYNKVDSDEKVVYSLSRHYVFSAGYDFEIDEKFNVYPVLLTRYTPNTPFQFDLGVMGSYQKLFWLGFTYKHEYAVGASVGGILNERLHVGITYDFVINDMAGYTGSSSELMIGYVFGNSGSDKLKEAKRQEALRAELDSLENKLKETADQTDKNTEAIDSLGGEIQKVRTDVDEAIEEMKSNPPAPAQSGGGAIVPIIPVGGDDDDFSKEYLDNKGEKLPTGFYIVVGSYSEQKWARQAKLRFINAGFAETDVLYNITNKFYNVFLSFTTNEEEARKNLKNARAEYPDAWLRKIQ